MLTELNVEGGKNAFLVIHSVTDVSIDFFFQTHKICAFHFDRKRKSGPLVLFLPCATLNISTSSCRGADDRRAQGYF